MPSPCQYKVGTRESGFRSSMAGLRRHAPMLHPERHRSQRRACGQSYWLGFLCKTLSFSIPSRFVPALSLSLSTLPRPDPIECLCSITDAESIFLELGKIPCGQMLWSTECTGTCLGLRLRNDAPETFPHSHPCPDRTSESPACRLGRGRLEGDPPAAGRRQDAQPRALPRTGHDEQYRHSPARA